MKLNSPLAQLSSWCVLLVLLSGQSVQSAESKGGSKRPAPPSAEAESSCPKLIEFAHSEIDTDLEIELEEHPLEALLYAGADNLALQHPEIAMNAFQRTKHLLYYQQPKFIPNPIYYSGQIKMFPVLSVGIPEASHRRIIGQLPGIEAFGNYIDRGADGDGSAAKMPMVSGPPGTAKTEFILILLALSKHLQESNPDFYNYTYEWHDLAKIPKLRMLINTFEYEVPGEGMHSHEYPFQCPLGDSPLVLLPKTLQKDVTNIARDRVKSMIKVSPTPWTHLCPQCAHLRSAVLSHYAHAAGKKKLSNQEIVSALSKHIRIKRRVVGREGKIPKVNAEGKDVDYAGLLMAPNPFILNTFGPSHPFAYWLNGKIVGAHGGMSFFDEYFRNDPTLRDVLLELQENRMISRGGSPVVHLDIVPLSASNTESIDSGKQNSQSRAQIDRLRNIPMYWSINPHEIGKTLLHMKNVSRIQMQSLAGTSVVPRDPSAPIVSADIVDVAKPPAPITDGNLDALFPLPERDQPFQGPDNRYKMWVKAEDTGVHISPHTLMFMATVVAGTRLSTDVKAAEEKGGYKVIYSTAFRDLVTRLKILTRRLTITPSESMELAELSGYLKEGTFGISTRDAANAWLTETVAEAQKPGNGGCVTPLLASKVFKRLLMQEVIQCPDNKTRIKWFNILDAVAHHFVLPALQDDVNAAIGQDSGSAEVIYDELFSEIEALQNDADAKHYVNALGETRSIDADRLREIEEIYRQEERRDLARGQIIQFHSRPAGSVAPVRRHEGLMSSIRRYLARASKKLVAFNDLLRVANSGEGTSEAVSKYSNAQHILIERLGYCPKCIKSALEMANEADVDSATQKQ